MKLQSAKVEVSVNYDLLFDCQHLSCLDKAIPPKLEFTHFTRTTFPLTAYKMLYPFQNYLRVGDPSPSVLLRARVTVLLA
jgi:hypothetical protein